MDTIIVSGLLTGLLLLDLAIWHWGFDSTDGVASPEWERRRAWRGFGSLDGGAR
jgi:hypothetical protein